MATKKSPLQILKERLKKLNMSQEKSIPNTSKQTFNKEQFKKDAEAVKKTFNNEDLLRPQFN